MQSRFRQISDMRCHACNGQTINRPLTVAMVVTPAPIRICHDRLPTDFVKRDILCRVPGCTSDWYCCENAFRIARRPLQRLHRTHRTASHTKQSVNTQMIDQQLLCSYHVSNCDDWEAQAIGLLCPCVEFLWANGAHAATNDIHANCMEMICIER